MTRVKVGLAALILPVLLAACGAAARGPRLGEAVVFVAGPMSGELADDGQTALGGVRLAARAINESGGLLGRRLVVRSLNDGSDPATALRNARTVGRALERGDTVVGVIGHTGGPTTEAALPLYEELGLVSISPLAPLPILTRRGHRLFFRVSADDRQVARAGARLLVEELGAGRVALLHAGSARGSELAALLAAELRARGGAADPSVALKDGREGLPALLAQLRLSSADALFLAADGLDPALLFRALAEAEPDLPLLLAGTASVAESPPGPQAVHLLSTAPRPEDVVDRAWIEAYRELEKRDPGPVSVNGYAAMQALAAGVQAAGTFDGAAIAAALRENEHGSILGPLRFNDNGDLSQARIWSYTLARQPATSEE